MVSNSRKIVRIFLASPSDLQDERRMAKKVVDEFNRLWADHGGYQVELVGWEDTVSGFGRPQAIINLDLEQCEYFIGMMHKRWGTPPGGSGTYTSGFEEEFETSVERHKETGRPEISLYFKEIENDQLVDRGPELEKVLNFKDQIIAGKVIYFEEFTTLNDFEEKIRRCVTRYVQKLSEAEKGEEQADDNKIRTSDSKEQKGENEGVSDLELETPFSVEGTKFLQHLISMTEGDADEASISAVDVARFKLLASIVEKFGNDKSPLGVHDANILFKNRHDLDLSFREKLGLIRSGLEHYSSENIPLWHWLAAIDAFNHNWLPLRSRFGETELRVGAITAMRLISEPLLSDADISREGHIEQWLSKDAPSALKVAALRYLAECGMSADLSAINLELERGDYQTKSAAVDAVLRINLRDSRKKAILALFALQPETVDSNLLTTLFENDASINTNVLTEGIGHRSSAVRLMAIKLLRERGALETETAEQLISDSDAETRFEALQSLMEGGRQFSDDEAKKILIKPKARAAFGLFGGFGATDNEGEAVWSQFREEQFFAMTDRELEQAADVTANLDRDAEFVLDERKFATRGNRLRAAIDDHFKNKFAEILKEMEQLTGKESELVEKARPLDEFVRKQFTRKGLDIICRKRDPQDLARVRQILDSGFVIYSDADIEYLRKNGEWEDIPRIIGLLQQSEESGSGLGALLISSTDNRKYREAAHAIYALGHERLAELLALSAPSRLLSYLILESTEKGFRALDDSSIMQMFHSKHDNVRKMAVLKCVRALPKGRLKKLLIDYVSGESQQYYNVIHWLDFGISIPRDRARSAAATVLAREWYV